MNTLDNPQPHPARRLSSAFRNLRTWLPDLIRLLPRHPLLAGTVLERMKTNMLLFIIRMVAVLGLSFLVSSVHAALPGVYTSSSCSVTVGSNGKINQVSVPGWHPVFSGSEIKGDNLKLAATGSWGETQNVGYFRRSYGTSFSVSYDGVNFQGEFANYDNYYGNGPSGSFVATGPYIKFEGGSYAYVSAAGRTITLGVSETKVSSWDVTSPDSWIHPSVVSGDVSVIVDPNPSATTRTGYVWLYVGEVLADLVVISQRAGPVDFNPDSSAQPGLAVSVTVTGVSVGATIRYTLDGTEPTELSPILVSGTQVSVPVPGTLRAKEWAAGMDPSATKTAVYTVAPKVATPTFTPDGGAQPGSSVNVTVSCATAGATIRYTTDGSEPTETSTTVTSGGRVQVPNPGMLKTRAWAPGLNPSEIKSVSYTVAPPIVSTADAIGNTATSATLYGTVNPNDATTTAQFEYGLTTAYGNTASVTLSPANGTTAQTVSASISGLQTGLTYHYRLTASNSGGTVLGADRTFVAEVFPFTYTIANGAVTITTYTGIGGVVSIPGTIAGLPVTSIGQGAFYLHSGLTSVTIPASVTNIGGVAFHVITFSGCSGLTNITVDAANPNYSSADGVLFNKLQTTLIQCPGGKTGAYLIPSSVTSIKGYAFSGCSELTSVTIPSSVTSIGQEAFYYCSKLTSASFSGNAPVLESSVFNETASGFTVYYTSGSTGFTSPTWNGYPAVRVDSAPTVTTTAANAITVTDATLNGSVNPKGGPTTAHFEYGLTTAYGSVASVTLSPANGTMAQSVSASISGLQAGQTYHYRLTANNIAGTGTGGDMTLVTPAADPDNFTYTDNGTSITITGYVTKPTGVLDIPATLNGKPVTSIGSYAFRWCSELTSVTIPSSVTSIGRESFSGCGLTSVTIPNSVTSIGNEAFFGCTVLTGITVLAGNISYSSLDGVLLNFAQTTLIQYPCGKTGKYSIPASVTSIGSSAFDGCAGLTSVVIPSSVTNIGTKAFSRCAGLTSATIPGSVTSIGFMAFYGCSWLTAAGFTGNAPVLESWVFDSTASGFTVYYTSGSTGFTSPTWNGYPAVSMVVGSAPVVTTAAASVLSATSATLNGTVNPNGVSTTAQFEYGLTTAYGNTAGVNLTPNNGLVPETVSVSISGLQEGQTYYYRLTANNSGGTGQGASMTLVPAEPYTYTVSGGAVTITGYTGHGGVVNIPGTINGMPVTRIAMSAFSWKTSVTSVSIPTSVTNIGTSAFEFCWNLRSASFAGNAPVMGSYAFDSTASGFTVYYTSGSTGFTSPTWQGYPAVMVAGAPAVTTTAASAVTATSATLYGTVNPNGAATTAQFEYGLTTAYGSVESGTLSPANGTTAQTVSASISGLQAGQTYHYRLTANNIAGTGTGADMTLATLASVPEIAVEQPSGTNLTDGNASIHCGSASVGSAAAAITFTVRNQGTAALTGLAVTKDGTHAGDFSVGALGATSLSAGASTTFTVTFTPGAADARTAAIHIACNDADENPFDITLTGTGNATASVADAIDQPGLIVTQGGAASWYAQTATTHDGVDAARSGTITHSKETWMQIPLTGPGTLTFWWKVSSESGYDYLEFYLDGVIQSGRISGTVDWQQKTYSIAAGAHTAKWRYMKDGSASSGTDAGWVDQVNFVPTSQAPTVITTPTSAITSTSATLSGTVNPNGSATTAQFEYGLTTTYGSTASVTLTPANGTTAQSVSAGISGLQAGQTYHYRLTATNPGGAGLGADGIFVTPHLPPVVTTTTASGITATGATLNGTVNPNGATTTAHFEYGLTTAYGSTASVTLSPASGTSAQTVSANISGLQAGQVYHYRLTAANSGGTSTGEDMTFVAEVFPYSYTIANGAVTITKYSGIGGAVSIPSIIDGLPVTSLGDSAFINCTDLTAVTIPNSVISIEYQAFAGCAGLAAVTIPSSVTSIGYATFHGCTGLTSITVAADTYGNYSSLNGVLFNREQTTLIQYPARKIGAYAIPNSVTSIEGHAFQGCTGLTSVTIPSSVTSIGSFTFDDCTGLTTVAIPSSVTSIGDHAFEGCTGLTTVTIPSSVTSIDSFAFSGCAGLTSVTIPNSVTSIGSSAFYGCTGLTTVTIPSSITSIDSSAFNGCRGLTSVTIPTSVTSIEDYTFSDCTGLTSVTIPNSITSIGSSAFYGCTGLTTVTIPSSVTSIGWLAFYDCTGLTGAIFEGNAPTMGLYVFFSTAPGFTVYYTSGSTGFTSPTWNGYPAVMVSAVPTVTTTAASGITATGATLNGTVNPNGAATTARFEYGPTTAYGNTANVTLSPANGTTAQTISAGITGLQPGQTYHYRLTATNSGGTGTGADMTLVTPQSPDPNGLEAPRIRLVGGNVELTVAQSVTGRSYQVQQSDTLAAGNWVDVGAERLGDGGPLVITIPRAPGVPRRFYRLALNP